ncbi:MAG: tetratricopeptide repeat protein [Candidatus Obscuribacterales bacterium]|nr:tetratricopeptide repeat protein [Candidatus Obscuribacterales bacterium]
MTREADYLSLGEAFEENGKYFKAERLYKKALDMKSKTVDSMSPELVPFLYNLGMVQAALDKTADAYRTLGRVTAILMKEFGDDHEDVKEIRNVLNSLTVETHELVANA